MLWPAVAAPSAVVERALHPGELPEVAFEAVVVGGSEVIVTEPGLQCGPECGGVEQVRHPASGLPMACGRPESWSPLRRMNVIARVFNRQPSSVRT